MKKYFSIFFCCFLFFMSIDDVEAQRRSRRTRNTEQSDNKMSFTDRINYEIRLGNVGFGGGFAIAAKPSIGFKALKVLTVGGGFRMDYEFISDFGFEDFSLYNYGPFLLARAKIMQNYYLQGEYTFFNFDAPFDQPSTSRNFPSIGGGFVQGGDNWKYNLELLFILDETSRNLFGGNTVEFWFTFSKNF